MPRMNSRARPQRAQAAVSRHQVEEPREAPRHITDGQLLLIVPHLISLADHSLRDQLSELPADDAEALRVHHLRSLLANIHKKFRGVQGWSSIKADLIERFHIRPLTTDMAVIVKKYRPDDKSTTLQLISTLAKAGFPVEEIPVADVRGEVRSVVRRDIQMSTGSTSIPPPTYFLHDGCALFDVLSSPTFLHNAASSDSDTDDDSEGEYEDVAEDEQDEPTTPTPTTPTANITTSTHPDALVADDDTYLWTTACTGYPPDAALPETTVQPISIVANLYYLAHKARAARGKQQMDQVEIKKRNAAKAETRAKAAATLAAKKTEPKAQPLKLKEVPVDVELVFWGPLLVVTRELAMVKPRAEVFARGLGIDLTTPVVKQKRARPTLKQTKSASSLSSLPSLTSSLSTNSSTDSLNTLHYLDERLSVLANCPAHLSLKKSRTSHIIPPPSTPLPVELLSPVRSTTSTTKPARLDPVAKASSVPASLSEGTPAFFEPTRTASFNYPCGASRAAKEAHVLAQRKREAREDFILTRRETKRRATTNVVFMNPAHRRAKELAEDLTPPSSPTLAAIDLGIDQHIEDIDVPFVCASSLRAYLIVDPVCTPEWQAARQARKDLMDELETIEALGPIGEHLHTDLKAHLGAAKVNHSWPLEWIRTIF